LLRWSIGLLPILGEKRREKVEQLSQVIREVTLEVPNRKIENMLRETFSPKRDVICSQCSLRPSYCMGSVADWHRCRYALRISGDKVVLPSDQPVSADEDKLGLMTKEIEELIIKTLRRVRVLTSPLKRVPS
jgi:hypothetical protein